MSQIKFFKFCASGNDFIAIDNCRHIVPQPLSKFAKRICRRKFSIGADGVLLLDKINNKFRMRIFNPDGSEPEMCGNGARAFACFIYKKKLAGKNLSFVTKAGEIKARIIKKNIRIGMTPPKEIDLNIPVKVSSHTYIGHFINTGVPHFVIEVQDFENFQVKETGRIIRFHKRFLPKGANVDFIEVVSSNVIKMRTYERGVEDETLACGTGAVASAIILDLKLAKKNGKKTVNVVTKGGKLKIYFTRTNHVVKDTWLEGEAKIVYKGVYHV